MRCCKGGEVCTQAAGGFTAHCPGHSTLLTLQLDDTSPTGFHATTNQPCVVESYIDTTDLIMGVSGDFDPEIMHSNIQQVQQLQHENTDDGWSELLSC